MFFEGQARKIWQKLSGVQGSIGIERSIPMKKDEVKPSAEAAFVCMDNLNFEANENEEATVLVKEVQLYKSKIYTSYCVLNLNLHEDNCK